LCLLCFLCSGLLVSNQLPQHVLQNPAVLVVVNLVWRVVVRKRLKFFLLAGVIPNADVDKHAGLDAGGGAFDIVGFKPVETQTCGTFTGPELQWQHSHPDEIAAMNAFETFRQGSLHTEKARTLRCPVARGS